MNISDSASLVKERLYTIPEKVVRGTIVSSLYSLECAGASLTPCQPIPGKFLFDGVCWMTGFFEEEDGSPRELFPAF